MAIALSTKGIKDGAGNLFQQYAVDLSGTGAGPFLPVLTMLNSAQNGIADVEALLNSLKTQIVLAAGTNTIGKVGIGLKHFAITPSDSTDLPVAADAIVFETYGSVVLRDAFGTDLSYTRFAGDVLPLHTVRVLSAGTTATVRGWTVA